MWLARARADYNNNDHELASGLSEICSAQLGGSTPRPTEGNKWPLLPPPPDTMCVMITTIDTDWGPASGERQMNGPAVCIMIIIIITVARRRCVLRSQGRAGLFKTWKTSESIARSSAPASARWPLK